MRGWIVKQWLTATNEHRKIARNRVIVEFLRQQSRMFHKIAPQIRFSRNHQALNRIWIQAFCKFYLCQCSPVRHDNSLTRDKKRPFRLEQKNKDRPTIEKAPFDKIDFIKTRANSLIRIRFANLVILRRKSRHMLYYYLRNKVSFAFHLSNRF